MRRSKRLASSANHCLPEDVITSDILPRLPTKSLVRFKSVSKLWYSHITNPSFAKHRRSKDVPLVHLLTQTAERYIGNGLYEFKVQNDQNNQLEIASSLGYMSQKFETFTCLVGMVHGLICCAVLVTTIDFRLWNPTTRELCKIDGPGGFTELYKPVHWGFGYVSSIDDFKILVISKRLKSPNKKFVIHVLTLKTNTWRKLDHIDVFPAQEKIKFMSSPFEFLLKDVAVLVGEQLFWRLHIDGGPALLAFDLEYETFSMVPLPNSFRKPYRNFFVSDIGHRLCACLCKKDEPYLEAWILERYGEWESWKFYFKISVLKVEQWDYYNDGLYLYPKIFQLNDNSGRLLIHNFTGGPRWIVFNPDGNHEKPQQSIQVIKLPYKGSTFGVLSYTESFVSPFTYVARASGKRAIRGAKKNHAKDPLLHLRPEGRGPVRQLYYG